MSVHNDSLSSCGTVLNYSNDVSAHGGYVSAAVRKLHPATLMALLLGVTNIFILILHILTIKRLEENCHKEKRSDKYICKTSAFRG